MIEARYEHDIRRFYTALYHVLLMPTLATDVDGRYRGLDKEVHEADGWRYYTDFSLWDTYRTLHPLLTLVYPEVQLDFLRSLTAMAAGGGAGRRGYGRARCRAGRTGSATRAACSATRRRW
mgnify:CR=1 FL=1